MKLLGISSKSKKVIDHRIGCCYRTKGVVRFTNYIFFGIKFEKVHINVSVGTSARKNMIEIEKRRMGWKGYNQELKFYLDSRLQEGLKKMKSQCQL